MGCAVLCTKRNKRHKGGRKLRLRGPPSTKSPEMNLLEIAVEPFATDEARQHTAGCDSPRRYLDHHHPTHPEHVRERMGNGLCKTEVELLDQKGRRSPLKEFYQHIATFNVQRRRSMLVRNAFCVALAGAAVT